MLGVGKRLHGPLCTVRCQAVRCALSTVNSWISELDKKVLRDSLPTQCCGYTYGSARDGVGYR